MRVDTIFIKTFRERKRHFASNQVFAFGSNLIDEFSNSKKRDKTVGTLYIKYPQKCPIYIISIYFALISVSKFFSVIL